VVILPDGVGTASEHSTRSFCGTRTLWFAPGVGLVKLRHEDQNHTVWAVYLVAYEGGGGTDYFPLEIGRCWRYRWVGDWWSKEVFDDVSRVHSRDGDVACVSSATWGVEQEEKTLSFLEEIADAERTAGDRAGEAVALEKIARMLDATEEERNRLSPAGHRQPLALPVDGPGNRRHVRGLPADGITQRGAMEHRVRHAGDGKNRIGNRHTYFMW